MECPECGSKLAKLLKIGQKMHCGSCSHEWLPTTKRTPLEKLQSKVDYLRQLCDQAGDTSTTDLMDKVFEGTSEEKDYYVVGRLPAGIKAHGPSSRQEALDLQEELSKEMPGVFNVISTERGEPKDYHYMLASAADYMEKGEVDLAFVETWSESLAMFPEVVEIRNSHLRKNCPPCPKDFQSLGGGVVNGEIITDAMMVSLGFGRWNDEQDPVTLWLCPVNWFDELPTDFEFTTIFGGIARIDSGASMESRMGYLAFGILGSEAKG